MTALPRPELTPFCRAYIEAALFSTPDESRDGGGDLLDDNYSVDDIDTHTLIAMAHDCAAFEAQMGATIAEAECTRDGCEYTHTELAGHDFWLTRNGHGAGFWDGDWSEPHATVLTRVSHAFGEVNLYVGDDGRIYQAGAEPPIKPRTRPLRTVSVTYETLSPNSLTEGDMADHGWIDETECSEHSLCDQDESESVNRCRVENAQAGCYNWSSVREALAYITNEDCSEREPTEGHIEYGDGSPGSCEITARFFGATNDDAEGDETLQTNRTLHVDGLSRGTALRLAAVLRSEYGVRFY